MYQNTFQLQYPNGDRYVGQLCNATTGVNVPHGQGTMYHASGQVYTGSFYMSTRHGAGKLTFPNGDWYQGNFANDLFHGNGDSYRANDGRRYVGNFVAGFEEGYGVITGTATVERGGKKRYEGYVHNGIRHGQGTQWLTTLEGNVATFQGNWDNGLLNGPGTMTNANKIWSGVFRNGKLEGQCTCLDTITGISQQLWCRDGAAVLY
jgi:hypothetical protein